jgi:threonyl-tRNA synthetase
MSGTANITAGPDLSAYPGGEALYRLRHSAAHVLATAVTELFPETKVAGGPPIEGGFYYDFARPIPFTPEDLERIEAKMREIVAANQAFVAGEMGRDEARRHWEKLGEKYKLHFLSQIPEGAKVTTYKNGPFLDLCRGPHLQSTGELKAFKLTHVAGAYWLGSERNEMLQRIYGTAFATQAELDEHLKRVEEALKRDHRRLGRELDLFSIHEEVGPGLVLWHPKLGIVRHVLEQFWKEEHWKRGYQFVYTPHIASEKLFTISGHLENYADIMYAPMLIDEQAYRAKPMNCPGHIMIYNSRKHSYRDLPIRYAELGTVYRYERSGVLHGMLRVRGFTQDDSHIFCTPEQLPAEIAGVLELVRTLLTTYGFEFTAYLATRPKEKSIGSTEVWDRAIVALREGADRVGIPLELDEGGGAFYGPKIDFKMKDALGREWQTSTVQCDFNLPERFDLSFTDRDGTKKRPIMVHRAIYGSLERFAGVLIEHYGGKFPFWLAPTQVAVIPIREQHAAYGAELTALLGADGLRVQCLDDAAHMNKKIKEATHEKIPFLLIVGDREVAERTVTVRQRDQQQQASVSIEAFRERVRKLQASRSLELGSG